MRTVAPVRTGGRVSRELCLRVWAHFAFTTRGPVIALTLALSCILANPGVAQNQAERRIPERIPSSSVSLQGIVRDQEGRAVPGCQIQLTRGEAIIGVATDAEGIFRFRDLPIGVYDLRAFGDQIEPLVMQGFRVDATGVQVQNLQVKTVSPHHSQNKGPSGVPGAKASKPPSSEPASNYPGLRQPAAETNPQLKPQQIPPRTATFRSAPDRWDLAMPDWQRYPQQRDVPYVKGHWYDPFNRNRLKGDYPIFGQRWFLNFTGTSDTAIDGRRLPLPSGLDAANPRSSGFFGRGEQAFAAEDLRFSLDLVHGDTSFRPADLRFRFTPEVSLNFLQARERGIVNADPTKGTERFDAHLGIQEAFVEAKLHDLSPNYDFVSVRVGIQQFTSDFRGLLFSEEQPGIRLFGNFQSNRIAYNLAWFYFLEKNTNSGLNTFQNRGQQVYVANVYVQDFLAKGYTHEFSFHYNRDNGGLHYDDNGFLVRPAPVGGVVNGTIRTHDIQAYYLGWASNGHIGGLNLSHAFYQALGHDTFNAIAGRRVDINARMGAIELSVDHDWARYRASFLYASGDSNNRSGTSRTDGTAHGFDSIVDETHFAGNDFSFWGSEGIRLTGTGIGLVNPSSFLPSLRANKEEGQANFVNPGVMVFNLGADFTLTPKLRAFAHTNYLRFDRTEPLELLLFQRPIDHSIGTDFGAGVEYRPPLTENIVIRTGVSALVPGQGFKEIYNGEVLFSLFGNVRFQF
jgi:hypothetical protein